MGDRCYCTLIVTGETDRETWTKLHELITYELCPEEEFEDGHFGIAGVNYGVLPSEVYEALCEADLSYVWMNDAGAEYGAAFELFNANTNDMHNFNRSGVDIMLSVDDACKPDVIENAKKWQAWIYSNKELVIK